MAADVLITRVDADDIAELGMNLRDQDMAELTAAGHADYAAAIVESVRRSTRAFTFSVEGRVACIAGVAPLGTFLSPSGAPWMLGTDLVREHARELMFFGKTTVSLFLDDYRHLYNMVHAENSASIRWLRRLGFEFLDPVEHPRTGASFIPFEMRK